MPGIMFHLAFAEEVYRHIGYLLDKISFFSGNLIPDLAIDKKSSSYPWLVLSSLPRLPFC